MSDQLWSIRETCAEFGVSARALRFYEAKALIFPICRRQKRLFTSRCRRRLGLILSGRRLGLPLAEIHELLLVCDSCERPPAARAEDHQLARKCLAAMESRRHEIDGIISELRRCIGEIEACAPEATADLPQGEPAGTIPREECT